MYRAHNKVTTTIIWLKLRICFSTMSKFCIVQTYNEAELKWLLQRKNRTQRKRAQVNDMVSKI